MSDTFRRALIRAITAIAPAAGRRSAEAGAIASATLLAAGLAWFLTRAYVATG